jgi:hypothetical protein
VKVPTEDGKPSKIIAVVTKTRRGVAGQAFSLMYHGRTMVFTGMATPQRREVKQKQVYSDYDQYQGGKY